MAIGNDVSVATNAEFELGAAKEFQSILGVFWGTGVGGGIVLNGERLDGRGAAGEIGHVVVKLGGASALRPPGLHGGLRRARLDGAARPQAARGEGPKTELFKIMEERGRTRLTSASGRRARGRRQDGPRDRRRGGRGDRCGVGSALNVLDGRRSIGGGLGIRFGEPYPKRIGRR